MQPGPAPFGTGPGLVQIIVVIPVTKGQATLAFAQCRLGQRPQLLIEPPYAQLSKVLEVSFVIARQIGQAV